jgi:hypothetical protein
MQGYIDQGAQFRELAARAAELFEAQPAAEKRRLLDFVVSECSWKEGELEAVYRQPFVMLAAARERSKREHTTSVIADPLPA